MSMLKVIVRKTAGAALAVVFLGGVLAVPAAPSAAESMKVHKLVVHVDSSSAATQNLALNNVENVNKFYQDKGEKVMIEVVAYGPGLHMLRSDTSKVKRRVETISLAHDNISFAACGNTQAKMAQKEKKKIPIMTEAKMVPSGVVRLVELQEAGWSYVRP